jgi:hypothetical protein
MTDDYGRDLNIVTLADGTHEVYTPDTTSVLLMQQGRGLMSSESPVPSVAISICGTYLARPIRRPRSKTSARRRRRVESAVLLCGSASWISRDGDALHWCKALALLVRGPMLEVLERRSDALHQVALSPWVVVV